MSDTFNHSADAVDRYLNGEGDYCEGVEFCAVCGKPFINGCDGVCDDCLEEEEEEN